MKRVCFMIMVLSIFLALPLWSETARAQIKPKLPQVLVTYPGDTDESIIKRSQWIEGAKKEGALEWWLSMRPEQANEIIAEFNKIYPFIKVTYWRGQEKERDIKFETEFSAGRVTVDIFDVGDFTNIPRWRAMGLTEKYTDIIPLIKTMDKGMYSKYGDYAQLGNNATIPMYNTKQVSAAEAPKSWEDLLNPKWKGAIGLAPEARPWYTLALGEGGWGVEKTEDFLKKLKQQAPIWTQGYAAGYNLLIAGEFKVMGGNFVRYTFDAQKKGTPVNWCKVNPVPITGGTFILPKKAPHPNAARLFIEWQFSPSGLKVYEKVTGYGSASLGSGTMTAKAMEGLRLVYRTEEVLMKTVELHLAERFAQILGLTAE